MAAVGMEAAVMGTVGMEAAAMGTVAIVMADMGTVAIVMADMDTVAIVTADTVTWDTAMVDTGIMVAVTGIPVSIWGLASDTTTGTADMGITAFDTGRLTSTTRSRTTISRPTPTGQPTAINHLALTKYLPIATRWGLSFSH